MQRSGKPTQKNRSSNIPIVQLLIMAIAITVIAAIFVQNLQPLVQIFFLGQKTLPIPLSVAMLAAFGIGGIIALTINAIASWRQDIVIRRAVMADRVSDDDDNEEVKSNPPPREQREVKTNVQSFYQDSQNFSQNPTQNATSNISQDNNLQEDLEDWEEEELEEDDLYEDEELEEYEELEEEEEIYEDEDPDTVPYGDLKKLKSAKPKGQKRDRPPLEARFIR